MLPLVLDLNRAPHITFFLDFLTTCTHQRITLDQWDSFLQFQSSVNLDLSNYDEDGACKFSICYLFNVWQHIIIMINVIIDSSIILHAFMRHKNTLSKYCYTHRTTFNLQFSLFPRATLTRRICWLEESKEVGIRSFFFVKLSLTVNLIYKTKFSIYMSLPPLFYTGDSDIRDLLFNGGPRSLVHLTPSTKLS